jgi:hypothetical protein
MDSNTPHPASLSGGSLLRHSSFVRAVCVNAPVRICAGAISDDRPYCDRNSKGGTSLGFNERIVLLPTVDPELAEFFGLWPVHGWNSRLASPI